LLLFFIITDNESNEKLKENRKSKNNKPDIRLQVLWCPLPDFVAVSFLSGFLYGGNAYGKNLTTTG